CNYFNYIDAHLNKKDFKNYIILGNGVPEGNTVYVLRRNMLSGETEIWNAIYGEPYFFKREPMSTSIFCFKCKAGTRLDPRSSDSCPLQEIACIANEENIWINKQAQLSPLATDFDLENKVNWLPFLTYNLISLACF